VRMLGWRSSFIFVMAYIIYGVIYEVVFVLRPGEVVTKEELARRFGVSLRTVDRKIHELLSGGVIFPVPSSGDFRKFVYVVVEDMRDFNGVLRDLRALLDEFFGSDDVGRELLWIEVLVELRALYLKARRNRLSATRILVRDLLFLAERYGVGFAKVLKDVLDGLREVMSDREVRDVIRRLVKEGYVAEFDVEVFY